MRKELWNRILEFDLDDPMSEYGFSIRLAHENKWPVPFAENAILEYKKFMYLAATSGAMVSPSEIVDIVWHQHLLFTQSYHDFCQLLGKKIEHIPSTHNRAEAAKFAEARTRTAAHYKEAFGEQPHAYWNYHSIHDSLELPAAKVNVRTFIPAGFAAMMFLIVPAYWLLKDYYRTLDSGIFIPMYLLLCGSVFLLLEWFNRKVLKKFMQRLGSENFLHRLSPMELIYMKFEDVEDLVHATVNRLIRENKVKILPDRRLELVQDFQCRDAREQAVKDFLAAGKSTYTFMLNNMITKAVFRNTELFVKGLKQYLMKTRLYVTLFVTNFITLGATFVIGWARLVTGLMRGKPIVFIGVLLAVLVVLIVCYLARTISIFTKVTIPSFYEKTIEVLPFKEKTFEWKFFMHGQAALYATFLPLVTFAYSENHSSGWTFGGGSGDGGGCSSCGSSCGGGCGGGCGGCGS